MNSSHHRVGDFLLVLLRVMSCILVIGSHVQRAELHAGELQKGYTWTTVINGHVGVWIFFLLSGFLISKGFFSGRYVMSPVGIFSYYRRRIAKIYIPYVLVGIFVLYWEKTISWKGVESILFLQEKEIYLMSISYLWTISNMVMWYLLAPYVCFLLMPGLKRPRVVFMSGIFIFFLGMMLRWRMVSLSAIQSFPEYNYDVYIPFLQNIDFFLWGVWINVFLSLRISYSRNVVYLWRLISIGMVCLSYIYAMYYMAGLYEWQSWSYMPYALRVTWFTIVSTVSLILSWYVYPTSVSASLQKVSKWLGVYSLADHSYMIYLFQTPLIVWYGLSCNTGSLCPMSTVWYRTGIVVLVAWFVSVMITRIYQYVLHLFYS